MVDKKSFLHIFLCNLAKSNKSLSSTGKSARNPGFRFGDSDTDEDVEVPGTKSATNSTKHGEEDDDFDFYG